MLLTTTLLNALQQKGSLDKSRLLELQREAGQNAYYFADLLIRNGLMTRDAVGLVLGDNIGHAYINLEKTLFQRETIAKLSKEQAERLQAIPVYQFGPAITVAMLDPDDPQKVAELRSTLGQADMLFTMEDELKTALSMYYQDKSAVDKLFENFDMRVLDNLPEENQVDLDAVVKLSEAILMLALKEGASDIHIEPKEHRCVVRCRKDGVLAERLSFPKNLASPLTSRYKVLARLDISERRKPQDGRIKFTTAIKSIDIRVSTLPSIHGETVVMRLLGSLFGGVPLNIDQLNISPAVLTPFKMALKRPNGMILVTGPTGSGKSTTLYAALNYIDRPEIKILTVEDPVEYEMPNFTQTQVDVKAGRTFGTILRAVLRQDPDVILLGETRDTETAKIAAEAALTGHLLLSTLHTNNALQAVTRLLDMGVEPHVIAPSIAGVLAQRLARRLCAHCKEGYTPDPLELSQYFHWPLDMPLPTFYRAKGCPHCEESGYKGRVGIHEFVEIDNALRALIIKQAGYDELQAHAATRGYRDMRYDGFRKALQGLTTLEEIIRVTAAD